MSAGTKHSLLVTALLVASVLAGAWALAGCAAPLPADGRLVVVDVDAAVGDQAIMIIHAPGVVTVDHFSDYVGVGARYWDVVGARLRTYDQFTDADWAAPVAARVHIGCATALERSEEGQVFGWYSTVDGNIRIECARPEYATGEFLPDQVAAGFAHELGHALGLLHLPEKDAVMNASGAARPDLSPADVEEFHARH